MKEWKNSDTLLNTIRQVVDLRFTGKHHIGLCPFHDEKTPSFIVSDEAYHCFGCGEHGDVVDFIQKIDGCDFKEAVKKLGISNRISSHQLTRIKRQQKLKDDFNNWVQKYGAEVGEKIFLAYNYRYTVRSYMYFRDLTLWEYHHDILINGSDEEKYELFREKIGKR